MARAWLGRFAIVALVGLAIPGWAEEVDFIQDVRPILSGHCFKCHGPDEAARKAGLRLDRREVATRESDGEAPIVPGQPDESELIRRIFASDEDDRMPPPSEKNPLSAEQKETLKQWIAEGAEYEKHWAFVPPEAPPLPEVANEDWGANPIDRFVLARLEEEGLGPSPQADRRTLIRRLYLDLIGILPSPKQVEAFVYDPAPNAYEKVVDRLLASPHYGERWARRWLDLARYADTNGYEKDRPRSIWPYRDWVIEALNDDMPFDQFTIEQIAGDMLEDPTPEQRIATGFHRNTMLNEEGGIDPLEYRFYSMVDRVDVTATTWLGLTMACAQCHTHKYDPITHEEYYQFMAFMNNADEPTMEVPDPAVEQQREAVEDKIRALEEGMLQRVRSALGVAGREESSRPADRQPDSPEALKAGFVDWLQQETEQTVEWTPLHPREATSNLPILTVQEDGSIFASGDFSKRDTYTLSMESDLEAITAIRLEALPDKRLPNHGPGAVYYEGPKGDFWLSNFRVRTDDRDVAIESATESFANGDNTAGMAIDDEPQSGWSINGGQGRAHTAVFALEEPLEQTSFEIEMIFERYYAAGLGRFRIWVTDDPQPPDARDLPNEVRAALLDLKRSLDDPDSLSKSADPFEGVQLSDEQQERLLRQFAHAAPEFSDTREEIAGLRKEMPTPPTTLVMRERPEGHRRPTFIRERGEFLQPIDEVRPAIPDVLPSIPDEVPRNRLTFARWLVSEENPLTPRVIVNRHWEAFFGTGLVKTVQDFGFQGEFPSHPQLLDWLAVEFVRQGWSLKRLHKLIVTSATYRQASHVTPDLQKRDPDNRLLARGPRFRLEAELIRDAALAAGGLLSRDIGGPSVFPPQPPGVTTEGAFGQLEWDVSEGADRYRRGLYTFAKRTTPYAMFSLFDAPSGEACVARRERSNTPLQALTLLNDEVFMEAVCALGRKVAEASDDDRERVNLLFRRCLTRPPSPDEQERVLAFYRDQLNRFESGELDPEPFVRSRSEGIRVPEQAAWAATARVVMNLDEMITKQ